MECPAKSTQNYRPVRDVLPWRRTEAAVVETSGSPALAWGQEEDIQEEVTTMANFKEKVRAGQKNISEKFNTGRANRYRPSGT